ncbi:PDZ domain-containing protein [Paenibacillus sp. FSL P4-0338]|uniref:PDZ domain-containing protein n=1 Tax=unclassified Paenibacillus TaxID=185978 RepID=UPI0003E2386C|nr:PDZ domain-containing protein [Paenibacillus sp. FSL R7-269]ETT50011.1 cell division topological determinant [Paenibacillus sp. FSL R7-269]
MNVLLELLTSLGTAVLHLLIQPYYYIAILFIALYYRRQVALERKLIHVKLHSWGPETWRTVWTGGLMGLLVSLSAVALGVSVTYTAVACIWVVSLVLMLFRVRYLCFAYAIGALGIVQFVLSFFPETLQSGAAGTVAGAVREMDIPALLALAALLHVAEALLARWQGPRLATPLFLAGKRGKVVGGYQLQAFWPLPLFVLIPAGSGIGELPWHPLLGGGLGLVSLPVIIGFSEMTQGMLPGRKAARTFGRLLIYSAVLLGLSLLADLWSPLTVVAALAAILLHEGLSWYSALEERSLSPVFVHPPAGRKVLAVLQGSPAQELGILPGEILLKVNGVLLTSAAQLHEALRMNPAFCKLEVQNREGESKYLQRAIYAGDHHQLGIILVPDPDGGITAEMKPSSIFSIIGMRTGIRQRGVQADRLGRAKKTPPAEAKQESAGV